MEYSFESFEGLKKLVAQNGGVFTVTMEDLRDAQGASKLGKYVVSNIRDSLASQGLKAFPENLPLLQHECVRIYIAGSPISKLFSAMVDVKNWDHMDKNHEDDQFIRDMAGGEAQQVLDQIRQMVCL